MILYLDTSALVKRYFKEPHSGDMAKLWQEAAEIVTSSVAYAEAMAAFHRKKRDAELEEDLLQQVISDLHTDWPTLIRIQVNDELNTHIEKALGSHPLRGFDAIHLASAKIMHDKFQSDLLFACFDQQLNQAAHAEGLRTLSQQ